jgi:hypothetical protein
LFRPWLVCKSNVSFFCGACEFQDFSWSRIVVLGEFLPIANLLVLATDLEKSERANDRKVRKKKHEL